MKPLQNLRQKTCSFVNLKYYLCYKGWFCPGVVGIGLRKYGIFNRILPHCVGGVVARLIIALNGPPKLNCTQRQFLTIKRWQNRQFLGTICFIWQSIIHNYSIRKNNPPPKILKLVPIRSSWSLYENKIREWWIQ